MEFCHLCCKNSNALIEMDSNSLEVGDEIIEFSDLLMNLLNLRLDNGLICSECQDQLVQFYHFKKIVGQNLSNFEWNQRNEIIQKLNLFLDDFDFAEDLAVLRYRQCFTVVPESKREMMQNFQSWQPRVLLDELSEEPEQDPVEDNLFIAEKPADEFDEIIVEENQDFSEIIEQNIVVLEEDQEEPKELNMLEEKRFKTSKEKRQWANETTKACYSIEKQEDAIVPVWTCLLCAKVYHSAQALRLHLLAKHINDEDSHQQPLDETKNWLESESRERRVEVETVNGKAFAWACRICEFTCSSTEAFQTHLIKNHNAERSTGFMTQSTNLNHDIESKNFTCSKCSSRFSSENSLQVHLLEHTQRPSALKPKLFASNATRQKKVKASKHNWTCKDCWFQFSSQRSFDSHRRLHETLQGLCQFVDLHQCNNCSMFFRSHEDLTAHTNGHLNGDTILISAEGVSLQKTILFKRLPIPVEKGNLVCGHCERRFENEINSKSHLMIHHINPLVCPKDGRPFNAIQPYICHLQKVHSDIFPQSLLCSHCKMQFDNIYERLSHMKDCDSKKYFCDHCDKKFSNKNYLNSHLKRELGLLSCTCQVCGKLLKAKDELKIHMRSHTKEKPYKCSICSKSYTTTSARASHMETHKDTVIQCELCSVKFIARRHYIIHFKRYHDEDYRQRKFQELTCNFCDLQFLRKDRLRDHIQKAHAPTTL